MWHYFSGSTVYRFSAKLIYRFKWFCLAVRFITWLTNTASLKDMLTTLKVLKVQRKRYQHISYLVQWTKYVLWLLLTFQLLNVKTQKITLERTCYTYWYNKWFFKTWLIACLALEAFYLYCHHFAFIVQRKMKAFPQIFGLSCIHTLRKK